MTNLEATILESKNGKRFPGDVWLDAEGIIIYSYKMAKYSDEITKKRVGVIIDGKNVWDEEALVEWGFK